jgi:hypothetical protein
MFNTLDRNKQIDAQAFTLASVLQKTNPPTFFAGMNTRHIVKNNQTRADGDAQGVSTSSYMPLQLKMPTHLQDKPQKLSDVVFRMLNHNCVKKLIAQYSPEQLQKIKDFIAEKKNSCTNNKEKSAFDRLLEEIENHLQAITPVPRVGLQCKL